ncbi:MAG: ATP-dependent sacrificial sulfur transferase LarE [Spirochaetota bacterium]
MSIIDEKYDKLIDFIKPLKSVIVTYSGGVDSTLLAKVCRLVLGKDNVLALFANSPSRPESEMQEAKALAEEHDISYKIIETNEINDEHYYHNPINKCYYCKKNLNEIFYNVYNQEEKYKYILNGTNAEDYGSFRPGIKSDKEYNIISPLAEIGFNKDEIREISRRLKLRTWDKPSKTCLATRIPTGMEITQEKLKQIEESEKVLINMGFENVRVRHLGDTARIEVPPENFLYLIQKERLGRIIETIKKIGFEFVSLDLEGYESGKMNKVKSTIK